MTDPPLHLPLLLLLLLACCPGDATAPLCPGPCTCDPPPDSTVNCSGLGLTSVPARVPEDTRTLLLSRNNLTDLFGQLPGPLPGLTSLDLSLNHVKQLGRGAAFHNLTQLRTLNLSRNDFRTVFNGVFRGTPKLEVLDMERGQVRFVEERVFEGLGRLKRLLLAHNQLNAVFPEWFAGLVLLEELRLEDNHISYVNGGSFSALTSLRFLSLAGNRIRGVSEHAFDGLSNLTSLNLEDNQLSRVPSTAFQAARSMKLLRLGGNSFPQLHTGDFVRLALEEASVENIAELTLIDKGAFWDLPYLKALHLHRNSRLQFVDSRAFINVPNLRILSLHGGNLSSLSGETVRAFTKPLQISLHENPLVCDCNIKWLHEIVVKTKNASRVSVQGAESLSCLPLDARAVPLTSLDASQIPESCPPSLVGETNATVDKKVGDSYVFQCRAHGLPVPTIHWVLPGGSVVNQTSNDVRVRMEGGPGSLGLHHIKPRDAGPYACVASNPLGEAVSVTHLSVESIDIHIFPLGVASTFVTVVWNGTARNSFPEYEIVYRREDGPQREYQSATVSQFFRSYTVNNLRPASPYKFCIGVKSREDRQYVQFSCTRVRTRDESFAMQGIVRTSNVAVGAALGVVAAMGVVVCAAAMAARKYRQRHYDAPPEKALVGGPMAHIPMENLHSPLMAHVGS